MAQSITLTASMRSNLASLKSIQSQMDTTQERLSTGKKVNSAIDNASSYYQSRALTNRASDLSSLLDSMGQGIQTIQAANEGLESLTSYVEQMKAVADTAATLAKVEAPAGTRPTDAGADQDAWDAQKAAYDSYVKELGSYQKQFNAIRAQAEKLINDTSYQGINLLKGQKLTVVFNESRGNSLEVQVDSLLGDKGIDILKADVNWTKKTPGAGEAALTTVDQAISAVTAGMTKLRSVSSELGNTYSIIQTRQEFTEALIDVLETGADNLVLADMNEESANYLALQTRQQLAINSLSLASQSAQSVLQLF